jgi:hypothetical protein
MSLTLLYDHLHRLIFYKESDTLKILLTFAVLKYFVQRYPVNDSSIFNIWVIFTKILLKHSIVELAFICKNLYDFLLSSEVFGYNLRSFNESVQMSNMVDALHRL